MLQSPVREFADLERYYAVPGADRPLDIQRKARRSSSRTRRLPLPSLVVQQRPHSRRKEQ